MGTKGAKMAARPPAANITMADLAEWWKAVSKDHGVTVRATWDLIGFDDLAQWRFTVKVYKGLGAPDETPYSNKSLVWPTASHTTVLGALLWLLMAVEDELTASEALKK